MQQTVDVYVDMYIMPTPARERRRSVYNHILREASASLLVQLYRAFQSLNEWDEQRYGSHAFLFHTNKWC